MDAMVTLKLTPREFDLVRTAIEIRQKQQEERGRAGTVEGQVRDPATIRASRMEAVELADILGKLR